MEAGRFLGQARSELIEQRAKIPRGSRTRLDRPRASITSSRETPGAHAAGARNRAPAALCVVLRDWVGDRAACRLEQVADLSAEEHDREDDHDRDATENQRVLGHRLALLPLAQLETRVLQIHDECGHAADLLVH